jgi:ClpA/ClpB-like protein
MRLLPVGQRRPAEALFACARAEAAELSLAVGVEHLVLAAAVRGETLHELGVDAETIREHIRADERDALASIGISLESVRGEIEERLGEHAWRDPCALPVSPDAKRVLAHAGRRRQTVTPDQLLDALITCSPRARRLLFELGVPVGTLQKRCQAPASPEPGT